MVQCTILKIGSKHHDDIKIRILSKELLSVTDSEIRKQILAGKLQEVK